MKAPHLEGRNLLEEIERRKREYERQKESGNFDMPPPARQQRAEGGISARRKWYFEPQSTEETDGWLLTYLDTITLLLVLLLVMLAMAGKGHGNSHASGSGVLPAGLGVLAGKPAVTAAPNGAGILPGKVAKDPANDAAEKLNLGELGNDVDVIINDQFVSLRINSEILFSSGQAELSLKGLSVLQKLINTLKSNHYGITIEGHTDSVPIRSGQYPSNWELSSARAGSVVRYFEANGIASNRLRAIGYADTHPLAENDTPDHRAQNRRVEVILDTKPEAASR